MFLHASQDSSSDAKAPLGSLAAETKLEFYLGGLHLSLPITVANIAGRLLAESCAVHIPFRGPL